MIHHLAQLLNQGSVVKKVTFRNVPKFTNRSVHFLLVNVGTFQT